MTTPSSAFVSGLVSTSSSFAGIHLSNPTSHLCASLRRNDCSSPLHESASAISVPHRRCVHMGHTPLAPPPWDGIDGINSGGGLNNPFAASGGIEGMSEVERRERLGRVGKDASTPSWSDAARREANAGNILAARHLYACAVSAEPSDGRVWLAWAKSESRLADFEQVSGVLSKATESIPNDAYLWHFWAKEALRAQGHTSAREVLQKGIKLCSNSSALLCELAKLECNSGNAEAARDLYEEAVSVNPSDSHAYMDWAQFEIRCRRRRSARAIFANGVKRVSKYDAAVLYMAYAQFEMKEGNARQARFLFTRSAEARPRDKYIWQTWACFEEEQGNISRARQLFERGVIVHGGDVVELWQAWGMLEQRAGNFDAARRLFARATKTNSLDAATWAAWGRLEATAGNPVEARRLFEHASECFGKDMPAGPLFLNWAMFEAQNGKLDEACRILKEAIARKNDSLNDRVRILHAWSGFEQKAGRLSKAHDLLYQAKYLRPSDTKTLHSLARLEIECNNYTKARSLLRFARKVIPSDTYIISTLALLEGHHFADDGGIVRARDLFAEGVRHAPNDTVLIRAWANFESSQGNSALSDRLQSVARKRPHQL